MRLESKEMESWKTAELSAARFNTGGLSVGFLTWLLMYSASQSTLTAAVSMGVETFEDAGAGLPPFHCSILGWSVRQTTEGNTAIATCPSTCSYNATVLRGAYTRSGAGTATVSFDYALGVGRADGPEVPSGSSAATGPSLRVYCESRSVAALWTSEAKGAPDGHWQSAKVRVKPTSSTFNLIFEAIIKDSGQVVGLDNVVLEDGRSGVPPAPTIPLTYPDECLEDGDPTGLPTDGNNSTSAVTTHPSGASPENAFGLLDSETTLLFAQILAILSVSVCFVTVGIHCLIWRKQRRLHKISSVVHLRPKPTEGAPHDSMLLEMNLVASDEPDQPTSTNSLCEPARSKCLQQLKESDILRQPDPRRATISHGATGPAAAGAGGQEDEDSDGDGREQQPPHPRTKSLPCRPPVNVYESIDEVGKYQPLTFGKGPAPGPPSAQAPAAAAPPRGRRLHARSRGVQSLAAVKKYRPSSVQYEEIGSRKNGLQLPEEPRDRSKSASHYDYVKRKAAQPGCGPRRNGWKYGQAPRPKSRAPAPPARLYDEPAARKPRPVVKVDSAPTLLLQNQDSSAGESFQTDYENTLEKKTKSAYDRPPAIDEESDAQQAPGGSQYFTLEPPVTGRYATSEDSDDERESERDVGRFEDAEESDALPNGTASVALRPLSVSLPVDIPRANSQTMADFDVESSCL